MDIVTDGAGEDIAALPHLQLPLSPGSSTGYSLDTPRPYDSGPSTSTGVWEDATSALGNIGTSFARQLQQQQRRLLYGDRTATVSTELEESGSLPPSPMPQGMRAYHAAGGGSGNSRREAHLAREAYGGSMRGARDPNAGSSQLAMMMKSDPVPSGGPRSAPGGGSDGAGGGGRLLMGMAPSASEADLAGLAPDRHSTGSIRMAERFLSQGDARAVQEEVRGNQKPVPGLPSHAFCGYGAVGQSCS